jgi:hypothetical protein
VTAEQQEQPDQDEGKAKQLAHVRSALTQTRPDVMTSLLLRSEAHLRHHVMARSALATGTIVGDKLPNQFAV